MKKLLYVLIPLSSCLYLSQVSALTAEQCKEYKMYESVSLSASDKAALEASCLKRYKGNANAMSNCTFYEGEDIKKKLKQEAATKCK